MKKQLSKIGRTSRRKNHGGGEHAWAVSYVDLLTLLLCFFIIFFSFDKTPKIKEELSILDKITSHFNPNLGKGAGPGGSESHVVGESKGTGKSLHDGKGENTQDGTFIAKTCGAGAQGGGCGQGEGNGIGTGAASEKKKADGGYAALGKMVQDRNHQVEKTEAGKHSNTNLDQIEGKLTNDKLQVKYKQKAIVIEFPNVSFFNSGSTSLNKDGLDTVNYLITVIAPFKDKVKIRVQGHTDHRPLTVKKYNYSDNWELSVLRATSVLKVFLQNQFTPDQLAAEGFADTQRAIASSKPEENLANLRRITLLIEEK